MRKLLCSALGMMFLNSVYANDFANLKIKISGVMPDNKLFLCVGNVGCVSIAAGDKGKVYPMTPGNIDFVYTTSISNMRLYEQKLPRSCNISVQSNQTLTITGHVVKGANQQIHINNLNCKVA